MNKFRRRLLKSAASASISAGFLQAFEALAQHNSAQAATVKIAMIEGLSGPFANTGEAVFRNLVWACERVNARGGIKLASGTRRLELVRYDSKGQTEEALTALRSAIDDGAQFITQGN
ncbi:MAG: ABC transporter substrate-binding protein, partial [Burkholderiaceae bacterium]